MYMTISIATIILAFCATGGIHAAPVAEANVPGVPGDFPPGFNPPARPTPTGEFTADFPTPGVFGGHGPRVEGPNGQLLSTGVSSASASSTTALEKRTYPTQPVGGDTPPPVPSPASSTAYSAASSAASAASSAASGYVPGGSPPVQPTPPVEPTPPAGGASSSSIPAGGNAGYPTVPGAAQPTGHGPRPTGTYPQQPGHPHQPQPGNPQHGYIPGNKQKGVTNECQGAGKGGFGPGGNYASKDEWYNQLPEEIKGKISSALVQKGHKPTGNQPGPPAGGNAPYPTPGGNTPLPPGPTAGVPTLSSSIVSSPTYGAGTEPTPPAGGQSSVASSAASSVATGGDSYPTAPTTY